MLDRITQFFLSWFADPSLIGIGLAVAFGAFWLLAYRPPLFRNPWLWAVMAVSAILTLAAVSFIQIPLQLIIGQTIGQQAMKNFPLLAAIPGILISGLVQEAAKLLPVGFYWWRHKKNTSPLFGLLIGAAAGAGFGIFEAQWVHNTVFASGWEWSLVQTQGTLALAPFAERFSTVAFHIGASALAGWGLAKGWGWQFYLLAALLHGIANYGAVLYQTQTWGLSAVEIYVAVIAMVTTFLALWLRWETRSALAPEPCPRLRDE